MRLRTTRLLALPLILAMSYAFAGNPVSHAEEPHSGAAGHAAKPLAPEHRDCHQRDLPGVKQSAEVKADEQQATNDSEGRKTRPSNITRKRGPRK